MDEHGLYDIYSLWHIPFWQTTPFFYSMIVAGALFLAFGISWIWRRLKSRTLVLSPEQEALQALAALQQETIVTREDAQACYYALTLVVKRYLYRMYGYDVAGLTDEEVVTFLRQQTFPESIVRLLEDINGRAVQVKFARGQALAGQVQEDIRKGQQIIQMVKVYKDMSTPPP